MLSLWSFSVKILTQWRLGLGLFVWLSATGLPYGTWERLSLSYAHNAHWTGAASYTFDERINSTEFFETQAYTSLMQVGDMEAYVVDPPRDSDPQELFLGAQKNFRLRNVS